MEFGIPLLALGGLYVITNQSKQEKQHIKPAIVNENFTNKNSSMLPNVDIANRNYPEEYPIMSSDMDVTSKLSTVNKFDSPNVYTDKYFHPQQNKSAVDSFSPLNENTVSNQSAKYTSLTGEHVNQDYFQHNNMVPYFGGHIRSRNVNANANESILDNYSGTGSQTIVKKEQAPLFAPGEHYQWANGMPNTTEFVRSRMNPSSKISNVNMFQEERVGPGLGLGVTNGGAGGFNSGMLARDSWQEKTVDELRVLTNPKSSGNMILGYEGPAIHGVTARGEMGIQEKHRPDTMFEMGPERYLTTGGVEKGNAVRPNIVDRNVSRPFTSAEYQGVAGSTNHSKYINGEYRQSTHIDLGTLPLAGASATGRNNASTYDYGMNAPKAYPNNRSTGKSEDYYGAIGGAFGAAVAPLLDALRPSRKENSIGNMRPYQNAKPAVAAAYIYDPNDKPAPTIRDTTMRDGIYTQVNGNQRGGAYEITEHQPFNQSRDTTTVQYMGNSSAGERNRTTRSYEAEYNQRNNDIKSSTIDGRMQQGNMSLFNSDINMQSKNKDEYLRNTRPLGPEGAKNTNSLYNFGSIQSEPTALYNGIQLDRNNGDVLSSLQGNPYTIPYRAK